MRKPTATPRFALSHSNLGFTCSLGVLVALVLVLLICLAASWGLLFTFNTFNSPPVKTLKSRVANVDGTLEAVIVELQSDVTVPKPTHVYIVPRGKSEYQSQVFSCTNVKNLQTEWKNNSTLLVKCDSAKVFNLQKCFELDSSGSHYVVNVMVQVGKQEI